MQLIMGRIAEGIGQYPSHFINFPAFLGEDSMPAGIYHFIRPPRFLRFYQQYRVTGRSGGYAFNIVLYNRRLRGFPGFYVESIYIGRIREP